MLVGELKKIIRNVDDNIFVMVSSSDYSYRHCDADLDKAEVVYPGDYSEYWGKEHMLKKTNKVIDILRIY